MRLFYKKKRFGSDALYVIQQANAIIDSYAAQGYQLTLRQLYYQFVARGYIPNKQSEYKRLGSIINDARLAGYVDWEAIVDRTRNLQELAHWTSPEEIIRSAARSFRHAIWDDQPVYTEVWIEKDALVGVIEDVCTDNDVPYFSCRGYTSQSEMWGASQRLLRQIDPDEKDRRAVILHLGDHDPSGMDMTRDIDDRLYYFLAVDLIRRGMDKDKAITFVKERFEIRRLALNWDQVEEYNPPPNPAKLTDSRARGYIAEYGRESWELDALDPPVMRQLIEDELDSVRDDELWEAAIARQEDQRRALTAVSAQWERVREFLEEEA